MSRNLSADSALSAVNLAPDRPLRRGLPALVIGGAVLIAVVWWFTLHLAGTLAVHHVQQKMADIATKARSVLQSDMPQADKHQALALLARFRDVQRIELRDARGNLIWRNYRSVSQVRPPLPAAGHTLLEKRHIDGLQRTIARHLAEIQADGQKLQLILQAEVDALLARYSAVALTVAKALSTVLLAMIFLMGYALILRWREQKALAAQLRDLLDEVGARDDDLREAVSHLSGSNAELLRRMLALGEQMQQRHQPAGMPGAPAETPRQNRKRA